MGWFESSHEDPAERRPGRIALRAALLAVGPALLAIAADLVRPDGLPLVADTDYRNEILVPCPENVQEARRVTLAELPADLAGLTVVDAREAGEYLAGHVPGAISIPHRTLQTADAAFQAALAADLAPLHGVPGDRILVCGDERTGSGRDFAAVLLEHGFSGVRYLDGGCAAWAAAGRKLEAPRTGATVVTVAELPPDLAGLTVVDARFSRNWRRAHLAGAISIPSRMVEGPADPKLAPLRGVPGERILVYGSAARGEGQELAEVLAAGGFPGVRYLDGGFEAWTAAGRAVEGVEEQEGEAEGADATGDASGAGARAAAGDAVAGGAR